MPRRRNLQRTRRKLSVCPGAAYIPGKARNLSIFPASDCFSHFWESQSVPRGTILPLFKLFHVEHSQDPRRNAQNPIRSACFRATKPRRNPHFDDANHSFHEEKRHPTVVEWRISRDKLLFCSTRRRRNRNIQVRYRSQVGTAESQTRTGCQPQRSPVSSHQCTCSQPVSTSALVNSFDTSLVLLEEVRRVPVKGERDLFVQRLLARVVVEDEGIQHLILGATEALPASAEPSSACRSRRASPSSRQTVLALFVAASTTNRPGWS